MSDEHYDLETIYESEIAPLIAQVFALCIDHDIPFIASVMYRSDAERDSFASSCHRPDGRTSPRYDAAWDVLMGGLLRAELGAKDVTP